MNINDRIEEFKCELKMYNLHKKKIEELEEARRNIEIEMATVKGICTDKIIYENISPDEAEKRLVSLIDKKMKIEKEIDRRNNRIEYVDSILSLMKEKELVIDLIINGEHYVKVAEKHKYNQHHIYRKANVEIKKAIERCENYHA